MTKYLPTIFRWRDIATADALRKLCTMDLKRLGIAFEGMTAPLFHGHGHVGLTELIESPPKVEQHLHPLHDYVLGERKIRIYSPVADGKFSEPLKFSY